jgi:putative endonuclease
MKLVQLNVMLWNQFIRQKLEPRVLNWLAQRGFHLIKQNWRYRYDKIDIIATCADQLHFIGITTRNYPEVGLSEQGITRRKMRSFLEASQLYLKRHPEWKEVIIDVLTVTVIKEEPADFILVKNIRVD